MMRTPLAPDIEQQQIPRPLRFLRMTIMVLAACHSGTPQRKPVATPVRVATTTRIDAPVNLSASGIVEPMQTVAVTAQVSGTLLDVLFREGEMVKAGQVLFRIDPRPLQASLDQARATLARDEAQADAGRRDDLRYQTLAAKGYVSRSQADQIHATALAQQATVEADRAVLRSATVSLGYATVRAPISGRTGSLLVRRGNVVSAASGPLVVINQLRPVLVRFPVADQDFPSVQRALATHPLQVTAMGSDSTQASERGQLSFLDNAIDSLTGTVTGKASFPNEASRLWPGELVYLTIALDVQRGVLAVPNEAVLTGQQGTYVYVVDSRNTAQTRTVVTGLTVGNLTVVAQGLADGERVVIDGQSRLNPGSRVSLIGTGADTAGRSLSSTGNGEGGTAGGDVTGVATGGVGSPNGGGGRGAIGANAAGSLTNGNGGVAGRSGGVTPAPSMTGVTGAAGATNGTAATGTRPTTTTTTTTRTTTQPPTTTTSPTTTTPNATGTKAPTTPARPPTPTPPSSSGSSRP